MAFRGAAVYRRILMSGTSWLQFAALIAVLTSPAPALGGYLARSTATRPKARRSGVWADRARDLPQVCRVDPGSEQRWNPCPCPVLYAFRSVMSSCCLYGIARFPGRAPPIRRTNGGDRPCRLQRRGQLRDQYQLAVTQRRPIPLPQNDRAGRANFVSASAGMCGG